ncbi:MAG: hypothetical protein Q7R40_00385 [Phaeospirillum sp.]|nr:hypothetical protein [Phaeospirillum sp.]
MSTSIASNVTPRTAAAEAHPTQPPAPPPHEPEKARAASPAEAAAFTSPVIKVDNDTGLALLVVRDGSTGEELDQYPSKKVVAEYQRVQGGAPSSSEPTVTPDSGKAASVDATIPPAPVASVAAPPVSPATGDARTTPSGGGVKPVGL